MDAGLDSSSVLPQTGVFCLTQQPPSHREVSRCPETEKDSKADGSRVPWDGDSVQQYCACKPGAMLWVTCPSRWGTNRAVAGQKDTAQPQCAAAADGAELSPCEPSRGSSRGTHGALQTTLAEPSASGSQPGRMCSGGWLPAALPSQAWGKLPNSRPARVPLARLCPPRNAWGCLQPRCPDMAKEREQGKGTSGTSGLF